MEQTSTTSDSRSFNKLGLILCLLILAVRLATLPLVDLIDSTEGRYAAAAVTMVEKGDYLTPWIDMGKGPEPYLGKPPMHFWLTIGSFKVFGTSPFSARIPSYLATLLTALMIFCFARRVWSEKEGVLAVLLYLSSGLTFFLAGAAVLDTTLMVFDTAAILLFGGYYLCGLHTRPRLTSILVGASLSGAFLTKGPVSIAIFLTAVIPWALIHKEMVLPKRFPLLTCIITFIVLTIPWYLMCEIHHPGFLYYFIVKENLLRIVSDNYGDRYGSGHPQVFGMSFVHVFLSFMPWSLALLGIGISQYRRRTTSLRSLLLPSSLKKIDAALLFAGIWSLSMPTFLLFTSQYTANYLAPCMPGLALLLGGLVVRITDVGRTVIPSVVVAVVTKLLISSSIVLSFVGIALGASWWIILPCWALGAGMYFFSLYLRTSTRESTFAYTAVIVTLLFGVVTVALSTYISSRRSTGEIFALLRGNSTHPTDRAIKVGFLGQAPFSSTVYSTIYLPRVDVEVVSNFDGAPNGESKTFDYYIASKRASESLTPPQSIIEVTRTRKWVLFKRASSANMP